MIIRSGKIYWSAIVLCVLGFSAVSFVAAGSTQPQNAGSVTLSVIGARGEVRDSSGGVVYEVDPGQHFKILVVSTGHGGAAAKPTVLGLDQFQHVFSGQSSNLLNINGRISNTTRFEYQLECGTEGQFALGPAMVNNVASNACLVRVRQRTQQESDRDFEQDYKRGVACQARLVADKDAFFLGEDITVSLEVYCWDQRVEVEAIQPQFDGFSVKELPHTISSVSIDGKSVRVVQKKYVLSTMWPGVKKIKPVTLMYNAPTSGLDDDFPFGGMMHGAFLFGPTRSVQQIETRTNGLEITVKELPKSDRNADAIGSFSSLTLSLDKNQVAPRTPINLSLKVIGKGDFGHVSAPRLKLPKALRSFPGTTESEIIKNPVTGESEKRFTYVIQPLKEGTLKVPSQEFLYFDPDTGDYKTLKSQETMIVVERDSSHDDDSGADVEKPSDKSKVEQPAQSSQDVAPKDRIVSAVEIAAPELHRGYKIPWTLWSVLAVLMIVLGLLFQHVRSWVAWHRRNPKKALKLALKDLERSEKSEADQLFGIAVEYFSLRFFNGDTGTLPLESIDAVLEQRNFPRAKRIDFMKFLTSLAGIAFGSSKGDKHRSVELRVELRKWLTEIDGF